MCVNAVCSARAVHGRMLKHLHVRMHAHMLSDRAAVLRSENQVRGDNQVTARLSSSRRAALALAQAWPVAAACRCQ